MQPGFELTQDQFLPLGQVNTFRRRLKVFGLYLFFLNIFGTLIKSPISLIYLTYGGYPMLFVDLIFTAIYLTDKFLMKGAKFTSYELVIFTLLIYVMLQAGFVTDFYFGQPVIMGMMAEKSWFAILTGIIFFYLLKTKAVDLSMIRDALLFGAWFNLPFYILMILTLNPGQFAGTLFVYCNEIKGGCQFEFDIFGFAFATIYYFIRFVRTNKIHYGLFFILFFAYIFFINQKRGTSLALLGTVGIYFLLNLSKEKIIFYSLAFILVLVSAVGLLYLFSPDILGRVQEMYTNVILVLMGQETGEQSADARIRETAIALKYFERNEFSWLFGNGKLNNDWMRGNILTDFGHFYPSDIGLLGVVFQFGLIGLFLGLMQYWLVYRNHRRLRRYKANMFYQAVLYFIIFFFVRGIPTGGSFFDPGIAIASVFVCIHYFFYYMEVYPEREYHFGMGAEHD